MFFYLSEPLNEPTLIYKILYFIYYLLYTIKPDPMYEVLTLGGPGSFLGILKTALVIFQLSHFMRILKTTLVLFE